VVILYSYYGLNGSPHRCDTRTQTVDTGITRTAPSRVAFRLSIGDMWVLGESRSGRADQHQSSGERNSGAKRRANQVDECPEGEEWRSQI
jgi:hypothetical protein